MGLQDRHELCVWILLLQEDLDALTLWTKTWGYILPINKSPTTLQPFFYLLNDTILKYVQSYPYLGVTIQHDFKYGEHVTKIVNKASEVLGLCQRNLEHCPQRLKELAYSSLVRSTLDNCASTWDSYLAAEKRKLETIQMRAVRFVTRESGTTTELPVWPASCQGLSGEPLKRGGREPD